MIPCLEELSRKVDEVILVYDPGLALPEMMRVFDKTINAIRARVQQ